MHNDEFPFDAEDLHLHPSDGDESTGYSPPWGSRIAGAKPDRRRDALDLVRILDFRLAILGSID
ncbi:hypothetical protein [Rhodococcus sp. 27YEA15]|uniref:hypothetical protein n=1 Tax=Rhodococcus sp. 27YEA15 TaxID=3156259 RepID=UPI003C7E4B8B